MRVHPGRRLEALDRAAHPPPVFPARDGSAAPLQRLHGPAILTADFSDQPRRSPRRLAGRELPRRAERFRGGAPLLERADGRAYVAVNVWLQDLYKELGVRRDARARTRSKRRTESSRPSFIPTSNPGDKKAEARFKAGEPRLSGAERPEKRKIYDEFGEDGLREGFDVEAARAYRAAPAAAGRVRAPATGNVEDLFGGGQRARRRIRRSVRRPVRRRRGRRGGAAGRDEGIRRRQRGDGRLRLGDRAAPSSGCACRTGRRGHGARSRRGRRRRQACASGPRRARARLGGPPGDLVLMIRVSRIRIFEREGLDLHLDLPITVGEAYRGAKVRVPTPDGDVTLTVPQARAERPGRAPQGQGRARARTSRAIFSCAS